MQANEVFKDEEGYAVCPAQKPIKQMVRVMWRFSAAGDLVCSPFGGVGTDVEAAIRTGRAITCIEYDQTRSKVCRDRRKATLAKVAKGEIKVHFKPPTVCMLNLYTID